MSENRKVSSVLLTSTIIALLLMAFLFDYLVTAMLNANSQSAGMEPLLILAYPLFQFILVLSGFVLFRYLFDVLRRSRGAALAFLLVGLLVLFATPLLYFVPVPVTMYALVPYFQPGSYMFLTGAMLGVIGLLGLLSRDKAQPKEA